MKRERGGDRERERTEKGDDFKGKGEEERTNSWNLVAGLRIVNRRWRENRRRGAAFSNILPVREYIFPNKLITARYINSRSIHDSFFSICEKYEEGIILSPLIPPINSPERKGNS